MSPRKRVISIFLILVLLVTSPFSFVVKAEETSLFVKITHTDYTYTQTGTAPNTYKCQATQNVLVTGHFNIYYNDDLIAVNQSYYEYHTTVTAFNTTINHIFNDSFSHVSSYNINGFTLKATDSESEVNVTVDNLKWNFPIESFPFTAAIMQNQTLTEWSPDLNYFYPTFECASGSRIFNATINPANNKANEYIFVLGVNANVYNDSTFNACFNITSELDNHKLEYVETLFRNNFGNISIIKGKITSADNRTANCYIDAAKDLKILSIYGNYSYYQNLSADFASLYNLSQHQVSVDELDNANADLGTNMNNMFSTENQYNQDLNSQLNNINFNDQLTGQQGFLNSSNFVITVFNQLIFNNPLTILIIIVCIFCVAKRFI